MGNILQTEDEELKNRTRLFQYINQNDSIMLKKLIQAVRASCATRGLSHNEMISSMRKYLTDPTEYENEDMTPLQVCERLGFRKVYNVINNEIVSLQRIIGSDSNAKEKLKRRQREHKYGMKHSEGSSLTGTSIDDNRVAQAKSKLLAFQRTRNEKKTNNNNNNQKKNNNHRYTGRYAR